MGREVYHGDPTGDSLHMELYDQGVREGALGLLLNSVRIVIITCFLTALLFKIQLLARY
jgi:solute carrier family 45 protein 1/2/4